MWTFAAVAAAALFEPVEPRWLDWMSGDPGQSSPQLDWLSGSWLSCENGREVAETWTTRRGRLMVGMSVTIGPGVESWEQMRIETGRGRHDATFFAQPKGAAAATAFPMVPSGGLTATFENAANDYPQRITYRLEGEALTARIERMDGSDAMTWRFERATLGARCHDR